MDIFEVDPADIRMSPFCILQELRVVEVVVTTGDYKTCKIPTRMSPPTNQHPVFCRSVAVPVAQPTVSKHWRE